MSEAETPRVDTGASSTGESQQAQQGASSDFNRVRADAAELGKNGVGDLLKCSVENDYGKGNPKITSDIESRMGIIRQITTKNGRNSKGELLGIEELVLWADESGDQREKTLRAYSVYLYLEEEIAGISDELKESKRDYIIFLGEKIVELSGVIGASKKTRLRKILPTVRRYALAVTSVVALGSLGYTKHLKNENSGIQSDYAQTSSLLENERQTNSDLEQKVQESEKEKLLIIQKNNKALLEAQQNHAGFLSADDVLKQVSGIENGLRGLDAENARVSKENDGLRSQLATSLQNCLNANTDLLTTLQNLKNLKKEYLPLLRETFEIERYIYYGICITKLGLNTCFENDEAMIAFIQKPDSYNPKLNPIQMKERGVSDEEFIAELRKTLKEKYTEYGKMYFTDDYIQKLKTLQKRIQELEGELSADE